MVHKLLVQFFTLYSSKIEVSGFRQYLGVFHPIRVLGVGGGSSNGVVHKLLM